MKEMKEKKEKKESMDSEALKFTIDGYRVRITDITVAIWDHFGNLMDIFINHKELDEDSARYYLNTYLERRKKC